MMRLEWSIFRRRSLPAPSFRAGRTITVVTVSVISLKAARVASFVVMVVIVVSFKAARVASFVVMAAAVPGAVSHFAKAPGGSSFRPVLALHGLVDNRAVGMFCIEQCDAVVPACPG